MADDSTDTAFGFILFILFLALLGYAAGGVSSSSSTAGTTGGTSQSLPSLEGGSVPSCTGTLEPDQTVGDETVANVNLKVYVDPMDAGQKCATASTASAGTLRVTLAYTADPDQMVSKTDSCPPGQTCTVSVQVNGTENFCVSAVAEMLGTASKVIIRKVVEPCTMAVPAMRTWPDSSPGSDHKEVEEGY